MSGIGLPVPEPDQASGSDRGREGLSHKASGIKGSVHKELRSGYNLVQFLSDTDIICGQTLLEMTEPEKSCANKKLYSKSGPDGPRSSQVDPF